MKKTLLIILLQCSMLAFAQDKEHMPTIREIIFGSPLDEKSKVEQTSKDGARKRVLTKIGAKGETKMNRYLMEEMDIKGLPLLSFNILSREEISKEEDFFKFSVSEYEMLFLDPAVQKAKAATEQSKKTIRVVPKLNEKPVDLNTVPQPDDYLADPCAGGRGLCLVWWLEYYEGGDLVGSELISVDCYCTQPGGGGGNGGGSGGGNAGGGTVPNCDPAAVYPEETEFKNYIQMETPVNTVNAPPSKRAGENENNDPVSGSFAWTVAKAAIGGWRIEAVTNYGYYHNRFYNLNLNAFEHVYDIFSFTTTDGYFVGSNTVINSTYTNRSTTSEVFNNNSVSAAGKARVIGTLNHRMNLPIRIPFCKELSLDIIDTVDGSMKFIPN